MSERNKKKGCGREIPQFNCKCGDISEELGLMIICNECDKNKKEKK